MALKRRTHPPDPRIRTRIRVAMEWHEMSQNDLAEMLGITPASVSLFLRGHTRPKDDTVRRIAEGLGEDFDYLMGYKDTGTVGTGRVVGRILSKSTPEELALLEEIPKDLYHELMGELALKYAKKKRTKGKTTIVCLGLLFALTATSVLSRAWEDYDHHAHHDCAHHDCAHHALADRHPEGTTPHLEK